MSGGQLQDGAHLSLTDFLSTFNPTAVDMCPSVGSSIASTSASSQSFVTQNYHPQPATFYAQYNGSNSNNTHYGQARSTHSNGQAIATHGIHHVLPSPANSDPSDSGISADSCKYPISSYNTRRTWLLRFMKYHKSTFIGIANCIGMHVQGLFF